MNTPVANVPSQNALGSRVSLLYNFVGTFLVIFDSNDRHHRREDGNFKNQVEEESDGGADAEGANLRGRQQCSHAERQRVRHASDRDRRTHRRQYSRQFLRSAQSSRRFVHVSPSVKQQKGVVDAYRETRM